MSWTAPVPAPVDGPLVGADRPMFEGYLGWQRVTLLNICAGLSAEQLATRPLPASNLSLLGLVRHAAKVERIWFRIRGRRRGDRGAVRPGLGPGLRLRPSRPGRRREAFDRLRAEWAAADAAAAALDFDDTFEVHGDKFSLRMVYVHMIGEYARHNGHADLLRERLDGVTAR